jgi:nucleoside-diphosphate-sugar epimerase
LYPADLSNVTLVDKAIAGSDIVYLVIGLDYNIKVWQDTWPKLMQAVINSCKRHRAKLVFFDNVYMYDKGAIPHMTEDSPINPPSRKGQVRREISETLMNEVNAGHLTALIARSADFYGPNNDKSLFHMLIYSNILKGRKPNWMIDENKKHSFTYTPDAAKATAILGNTPEAYNQIWHLPTHREALTGKEFISIFAKEMKVKDKYMVVPLWMMKIMGWFTPLMRELPEMMYQYDQDYFFDSSKFEKRFNYKPVTYQEGIRQMIITTTI